METVTLTNVQGIARKSGTDCDGNVWTQYEVDYLAEQEDGECTICGEQLQDGWLCLDGGDEVCNYHVEIPGLE